MSHDLRTHLQDREAIYAQHFSLLNTLHLVWRQLSSEDRLRFLTEMLTPHERRALQCGFEEEAETDQTPTMTFLYTRGQTVEWAEQPDVRGCVLHQRMTWGTALGPVSEYFVRLATGADVWCDEADLRSAEETP